MRDATARAGVARIHGPEVGATPCADWPTPGRPHDTTSHHAAPSCSAPAPSRSPAPLRPGPEPGRLRRGRGRSRPATTRRSSACSFMAATTTPTRSSPTTSRLRLLLPAATRADTRAGDAAAAVDARRRAGRRPPARARPGAGPAAPCSTAASWPCCSTSGTLIPPTTKAQYKAAPSRPLPPRLFSHNDQQSIWQSSAPRARRAGAAGWAICPEVERDVPAHLHQRLGQRGVPVGQGGGAVPGRPGGAVALAAAKSAVYRIPGLFRRAQGRSRRRRAPTCSRTS